MDLSEQVPMMPLSMENIHIRLDGEKPGLGWNDTRTFAWQRGSVMTWMTIGREECVDLMYLVV